MRYFAGLDLALGLRPIGGTQARFVAPVLGKPQEGLVPAPGSSRSGGLPDHPRAVIQQPLAEPAEVFEGPFMRLQERPKSLIAVGLIAAPATEARGHDEPLHRAPAGTKQHQRLAVVDLGLFPRLGLEAGLADRVGLRLKSPRRDEALHRLVAAGVALGAQFLEEDLGGVIDLAHALGQPRPPGAEQAILPWRPCVWLPGWHGERPANCLAIQVEAPGDFGDRHPRTLQCLDLRPPLLPKHGALRPTGLRWADSARRCRQQSNHVRRVHNPSPSQRRGGEISVTAPVHFCVTDDTTRSAVAFPNGAPASSLESRARPSGTSRFSKPGIESQRVP